MAEARTRTEYRALVRAPASILATPAERKQGYTERWTSPGASSGAILQDDYDLRRSEESHAYIVAWEEREVTLGPWKDLT